MSIMKGSTAEVHYSGTTIRIFGVALLVGTLLVFAGTIPALLDEGKAVLIIAVGFLMAFQISLTISTLFFLQTTVDRFDDRVDAYHRLAAVNGCSDDMTSVPWLDAQADWQATEERLRGLIGVTVLMLVSSLFVGVVTIPAYYCVHYVADMGDGRGFYEVSTGDVDRAALPVATQGKVEVQEN